MQTTNDLSQSRIVLKQDSTLIAVIDKQRHNETFLRG
jgi:hypothetical protein